MDEKTETISGHMQLAKNATEQVHAPRRQVRGFVAPKRQVRGFVAPRRQVRGFRHVWKSSNLCHREETREVALFFKMPRMRMSKAFVQFQPVQDYVHQFV